MLDFLGTFSLVDIVGFSQCGIFLLGGLSKENFMPYRMEEEGSSHRATYRKYVRATYRKYVRCPPEVTCLFMHVFFLLILIGACNSLHIYLSVTGTHITLEPVQQVGKREIAFNVHAH